MNQTDPSVRLYAYKLLKEQLSLGPQADLEDTDMTVNGYATYLCSEPFSDKIMPQQVSSFIRGSIYYTDKGLYCVDISLVTEIDNVIEGVQLLSFNNIKDAFKKALENDTDISQRSSASLEVFSIAFTYVLIEDEKNPNKATYVPAWYFLTKDNKQKSGEQSLTYSHVINALDGSDLTDSVK